LSETSQDINIDPDSSSERWPDMNAIPGTSSETAGSEVITSENLSDVSENQVSYEDLERQLAEMKQLLRESKAKIVQLEAEVNKIRAHASNLSEKCENLDRRIFKLHNFISDEDIAFYMGFLFFGVFMARYNYLTPEQSGENNRYWRSVPKDVGPECYEKDLQLGVGPGKARTLNPKEEFFLVMCRFKAGICRTPPGTFIQDIPSHCQ